MNYRTVLTRLAAVVALLGWSQSASAALINQVTNGTFDSDLSGWTIDAATTTGVTWSAGAALVGAPGTPGVALFSQTMQAPSSAHKVLVNFDYTWEFNAPPIEDTFSVELQYVDSSSSAQAVSLLVEGSNAGLFNSTVSFSSAPVAIDLLDGADNLKIIFRVDERNSPVGTRVVLDNVEVLAVVPVASSGWLLGVALLGLLGTRRRLANSA